MDGIKNKTQFAMKRYQDKMKTERKQIHLTRNIVKKWNEKAKNNQIRNELKKIYDMNFI